MGAAEKMNDTERYLELEAVVHALDDDDAAVREAAFDALDRIVAADPDVLVDLLERVNDEDRVPLIGLTRYLVHVPRSRVTRPRRRGESCSTRWWRRST
jgi:hypothetical protein